jgi:signal transduction histidine kinase
MARSGGGRELNRSRSERLRRNSLLLGFLGLLILIIGDGALSYHRVAEFEEEIRERGRANFRHLQTVLELEEQIKNLSAEARLYAMARSVGGYAFPMRARLARIQKDIEATLAQEDASRMGELAGWPEFKAAFAAYAAELSSDGIVEARGPAFDRLERAAAGLISNVKQQTQMLDDDSRTMRKSAQRDIIITTAICFLAGLGVSIVAFAETRRRMRLLERAYANLVESREFAESILEGMDSAVLTVDERGAISSINGPALYVLGLASERDAVGRPLLDALAGQPRIRGLLEPLVGAPVADRRYLGRVALGKGWLFDVGASPLGGAGVARGFIVTLSDVTEAERASEALRRNRALSAVGQMTAQVAHEIKNPLGGVQLAAQLLERRLKNDPEALEIVRRINSSVDHLSRTVSELNQFARPNELALAPVSLAALFEELLLMVGDKIQAKNITVVRQYADYLPPGQFDAGELRKAFINFLVNALEASPDGGRVEIAIDVVGNPTEHLRVAVRDEGTGMSEETLRRLFEPFYTTKSTGTGLGMVIARKIVEQHKGQLEVTSAAGEGTEIVVTLPLEPAYARETGAEVNR